MVGKHRPHLRALWCVVSRVPPVMPHSRLHVQAACTAGNDRHRIDSIDVSHTRR